MVVVLELDQGFTLKLHWEETLQLVKALRVFMISEF